MNLSANQKREVVRRTAAIHTDPAWSSLGNRLAQAYCTNIANVTTSRTGIVKPKTRTERHVDEAVFHVLSMVAADFPGQPLGMTSFAVESKLAEFVSMVLAVTA